MKSIQSLMTRIKQVVLILSLFISSFSVAQMQVGDISVNYGYINQMDFPESCMSQFMMDMTINIQNSFLNDSIKIISNWGQITQIEVNQSGNQNWNAHFTMLMAFVDHEDYGNGYQFVDFIDPGYYKVISGPDTLYFTHPSQGIFISDPCIFSNVEGKIYIDNDGDCAYSTGDNMIGQMSPNFMINYSGSAANTNMGSWYYSSAGYYKNLPIYVPGYPIANYTVSLPTAYAFAFSQDTDCNTLSYTLNSLPQTDIDFILKCETDIDTYVSSSSIGFARPFLPSSLHVSASNIGCTGVSGDLKLVLDPNVSYVSYNPAPDNINGDTLIWNYANLKNLYNGNLYYNLFGRGIEFTPNGNVNIGDTLVFELITQVHPNDINPMNNSRIIKIPVVNSYDPNIKEVLPAGEGEEGFIPMDTEELVYTVHFQNTGNAPAIHINVLDTLDSNLDFKTFKIISSSHTMSPQWVEGIDAGILKFNFQNINLPDSINDEPNSHGSLTYKINLKPNLPNGTTIMNTAHIYFDYNEAIVTNTTVSTLHEPIDDGGNNTGISSNDVLNVQVYPNPTSGVTNFKFQSAQTGQLIIQDVTGKIVITNDFSNTNLVQINTYKLSKGIYFYTVTNEMNVKSIQGKLVVR